MQNCSTGLHHHCLMLIFTTISSADPFVVHFDQELQEEDVEELTKILAGSLEYQHSVVSTRECSTIRNSQCRGLNFVPV